MVSAVSSVSTLPITRMRAESSANSQKNYSLALTGGSDFHGAAKPDIEIGSGRGGLRVSALYLDDTNFLCSWLEWAEAKQLLFSTFAVPPQRSSPPAYDLPAGSYSDNRIAVFRDSRKIKTHIDPGLTHCLPGSFFLAAVTDYLFIYLRGCCCKNKYKSRSFFPHFPDFQGPSHHIAFFFQRTLFPQFLTYFRRYNSDLAPELQKRPHPPHRDLSAADYKHLPPLKVHKQWKICHFFRSFPSFWYIFDSPPCLRQIFPINSIKIQFRLFKTFIYSVDCFFPYPSGRIQIVKRKTK